MNFFNLAKWFKVAHAYGFAMTRGFGLNMTHLGVNIYTALRNTHLFCSHDYFKEYFNFDAKLWFNEKVGFYFLSTVVTLKYEFEWKNVFFSLNDVPPRATQKETTVKIVIHRLSWFQLWNLLSSHSGPILYNLYALIKAPNFKNVTDHRPSAASSNTIATSHMWLLVLYFVAIWKILKWKLLFLIELWDTLIQISWKMPITFKLLTNINSHTGVKHSSPRY